LSGDTLGGHSFRVADPLAQVSDAIALSRRRTRAGQGSHLRRV